MSERAPGCDPEERRLGLDNFRQLEQGALEAARQWLDATGAWRRARADGRCPDRELGDLQDERNWTRIHLHALLTGMEEAATALDAPEYGDPDPANAFPSELADRRRPRLDPGVEQQMFAVGRLVAKLNARSPANSLPRQIEVAMLIAERAHACQLQKGTTIPYVAHLLAVTAIVLEHGGTDTEAAAALLHDAIEDQGGAEIRESLRACFGDLVVAIVDGCTDAEVIPKPPWRARKEAYIAHLADASPSIVLVSAADKLHNARAILADYRQCGEALWERFNGGREGTLWYYRALVDAYRKAPGDARTAALVDELDRVVTELEGATASA
jgi:hypothetical protein